MGGGVDLRIIFCRSINARYVVEIPWGGGDTQNLSHAKEFIWIYALKDGGNTKTSGTSTHALAPTPRDCTHEPPGETFLLKILTISHLQEFNHN